MNDEKFVFDGENVDEKVIFVLRRHPWTLMHAGLWVVVLLLILTAIFVKYQGSWVSSWAIFLLLPIALYIGGRAWFIWSNSVSVLTNQRLMAVDQTGWFQRKVSELNLEDILKIAHEIKGPSATFFNYGNVNVVASGATESDLTLTAVFDPYEVQQRIIRAKREPNEPTNSKIEEPETEEVSDKA